MASSSTPLPISWDSVASGYLAHASHFTSLHHADLLQSSSRVLQSARIVLDIGCGPGSTVMAYLRAFPYGIPGQTLIMTDLSPKMVQLAERTAKELVPKEYPTKMKFLVQDGQTLKDVENDSVDVVMSAFAVFLIPNVEQTLRNVKRVLKKGGAFVNAAWTNLPENAAKEIVEDGFGKEFQVTMERVFAMIMKANAGKKEMAWKQWGDKRKAKDLVEGFGFKNIGIHRTIHSTPFGNVEEFWKLVSETCPFIDMKKLEEERKNEIMNTVKLAFDVKGEDVLFVIMSSNIVQCTV